MPGILNPPPLLGVPPIGAPRRGVPIPKGAPRGGVPIPIGNPVDAEEKKLQKLKSYKTHCENLALLYEHKHNNEIIPLVNYIKQIREHTPEKRIGDLNIPKFIASLKMINVPDFNDTDLQRKIQEQKDMMRNSTNKVKIIRKKIEDFGVTIPDDVLLPGPMGAPPHFTGPMGAPPHFTGPMGAPFEPEKGRMTRAYNTVKRFRNAATQFGKNATQKLRRKKQNHRPNVLPGGFKSRYKNKNNSKKNKK